MRRRITDKKNLGNNLFSYLCFCVHRIFFHEEQKYIFVAFRRLALVMHGLFAAQSVFVDIVS